MVIIGINQSFIHIKKMGQNVFSPISHTENGPKISLAQYNTTKFISKVLQLSSTIQILVKTFPNLLRVI